MLIARVTSGGSLDSNFGQDNSGFATFSQPGTCSAINARAVDIDSAGRIVVSGYCSSYNGTTITVFSAVRLRGDNGTLDTSFGASGVSFGQYAAGSVDNDGEAIAFDASGHPIVGGSSESDSGVSRLTYDLIYTNNFELAPRGCLPPNCN
jgi:hypothetical protein